MTIKLPLWLAQALGVLGLLAAVTVCHAIRRGRAIIQAELYDTED